MEAITTWAKENYDLITLGVGILGTLIGVIGVIHEKKKAKQSKKDQETVQ